MDYIGEAGVGMALYVSQMPGMNCRKLNTLENANCGDFDLCWDDRAQLHLRKLSGVPMKLTFSFTTRQTTEKRNNQPVGIPDGANEWTWNGFEGSR